MTYREGLSRLSAVLASTDSSVTKPSDLTTDLEWIEAVIPGGVHESLLAAGQIAHPFLDDNTSHLRWIEDRTWWYRLSVPGPATVDPNQRVRLTLPSVDTVATIWFNDVLLGTHANAFRPFVADVTALVRADNELVVRIAPHLEGLTAPPGPQKTLDVLMAYIGSRAQSGATEADAPVGLLAGDATLTLRRKPTYSWGWDFAPRLPSVGLLEFPRLTVETSAVVTGCHIRTAAIEARNAIVAIDIDVEAFANDTELRADVVLTSPVGVETAVCMALDGDMSVTRHGSAVVTIPDAQLWWTHDLGDPALYDVVVQLRDADTTFATQSFRVGLRTIALDRNVDIEEGGRLFRFLLNGVPVVARGSNWVPASMLRGSVSPDTVRELVALARDGGQNMLRIWGGGAYEQDAFYDTCDELGVMVWQDFMFACFDYPSEDLELQAEVAKEAAYQVARLRNHASIAIWSGNNEVEVVHQGLSNGSLQPGDWGWHIFHGILPDAVNRQSPGAIYWPGSPWGEGDPAGVNGPLDGDRHFWDVWHGRPEDPKGSRGEAMHWHRYADDLGKFSSEFGLQAAPPVETLTRWATAAPELGSVEFKRRIKDVPRSKGKQLISYEIGEPSSIEEYVEYSMACQAEGLKFGIEHYRRRQSHCGGTLVWQFNDVWPGFSWSVVDYDLVPKAGYYFLQRAYQPVVASFRKKDGGVELWVTNSGVDEAALDLTVQIADFNGDVVVDATVEHVAGANTSSVVWSSTAAAPGRFAWVTDRSQRIPANRLFFSRLGDLPLGSGTLEAECRSSGAGSATVRLTSTGYTYFNRVTADRPGVRFSQNYVDLRDGDVAEIHVTGLPLDIPPSQVLAAKSWGCRPYRWVVA